MTSVFLGPGQSTPGNVRLGNPNNAAGPPPLGWQAVDGVPARRGAPILVASDLPLRPATVIFGASFDQRGDIATARRTMLQDAGLVLGPASAAIAPPVIVFESRPETAPIRRISMQDAGPVPGPISAPAPPPIGWLPGPDAPRKPRAGLLDAADAIIVRTAPLPLGWVSEIAAPSPRGRPAASDAALAIKPTASALPPSVWAQADHATPTLRRAALAFNSEIIWSPSYPWAFPPVANARDTALQFAPLRAFVATFSNAGIEPSPTVAGLSAAPANTATEPAPIRSATAS